MSNTPKATHPTGPDGSHAVSGVGVDHTNDHDEALSWKETLFGSGRSEDVRNVSWGAVFAGVVSFLAIVLLFALATASFELDGSPTGATIMTILGLVLGLFVGGAIAGALAVRAGFIHGFLTWAGSVVAAVVLATLIALGAAGAVGGVLGTVTNSLIQAVEVQPGDNVPTPTQEQLDEAGKTIDQYRDDAKQVADDAAEAAQKGATTGFWGLLLGSLVAALGGLVGSRSVANKDTTTQVWPVTHRRESMTVPGPVTTKSGYRRSRSTPTSIPDATPERYPSPLNPQTPSGSTTQPTSCPKQLDLFRIPPAAENGTGVWKFWAGSRRISTAPPAPFVPDPYIRATEAPTLGRAPEHRCALPLNPAPGSKQCHRAKFWSVPAGLCGPWR